MMADAGVGDYFITDVDSDLEQDDERMPLVVPALQRPVQPIPGVTAAPPPPAVPATPARPSAESEAPSAAPEVPSAGREATGVGAGTPEESAPPVASLAASDATAPAAERVRERDADTPAPTAPFARVEGSGTSLPTGSLAPRASQEPSREELLAAALDELMEEDADIHAAALVSLDGFTMASALPAEMQSDRVGAMSAAILALGERAAAELGRGHLSQVFIEGEDGYVFLIAAGSWAVLTAIADPSAKLGLVIYDMKKTAERIGRILG